VPSDEAFIHPTAIVEEGVTLGRGVKIWHHCHVRTGASIGDSTQLGKGVFVDAGVNVGARVKAQNHVYLPAGLTIGDDVFLGPACTFTNDVYPRAGDDWELTPTTVGRGASVGANATVIAGRHLAAWSVVGAGAVVTRAVEPFELVAGNPARRLGWVDRSGHVVARGLTAARPADLVLDPEDA
jgi:UDP-2-acetamido-3-amino-2,3-dideoxy-glucuronate N-acetyltransferase